VTEDRRAALRVLQREVQARTEAMEASHGPWPCRAGCDTCCRRLGAIPSLSDPEFEALAVAIEALPPEARAEVHARVHQLRPDPAGRYTCPLLDDASGRCRVYEARPIACRTYGFYAGRDGDYWCEQVTAHVGERRDTLVSGNQVAVDRSRDATLGPSIDLVTRLRRRGASTTSP